MNKPFTLYYGYRENDGANQKFVSTPKIGKIEGVVKVTSAYDKLSNKNLYALVGDNENVFCLGMVKKYEYPNGGIIYKGQKVYSYNKKTLSEYYRQKANAHAKKIKNGVDNCHKQIKEYPHTLIWYEEQIRKYEFREKETYNLYKQLIENIKKA